MATPKRTGHHTALYSRPEQVESTDNAIRWLDSAGVPLKKVAIGMAFYARIFQGVDSIHNGLYRPCTFFAGDLLQRSGDLVVGRQRVGLSLG